MVRTSRRQGDTGRCEERAIRPPSSSHVSRCAPYFSGPQSRCSSAAACRDRVRCGAAMAAAPALGRGPPTLAPQHGECSRAAEPFRLRFKGPTGSRLWKPRPVAENMRRRGHAQGLHSGMLSCCCRRSDNKRRQTRPSIGKRDVRLPEDQHRGRASDRGASGPVCLLPPRPEDRAVHLTRPRRSGTAHHRMLTTYTNTNITFLLPAVG